MKPVFQTRYGEGKGNCFQAALASVLELELEEVPDFVNVYQDDWFKEVERWLYKKFRAVYVFVTYEDFLENFADLRASGTYYIQVGPNQNDVMHCVVAQHGEMVHNPNRTCKGLKEVKYCEFLAFLNIGDDDAGSEGEEAGGSV